MEPASFARRMHLGMTHWSIVLMGLHLGLHVPVMAAGFKLERRAKTVLTAALALVSGLGLFLFLRNNYLDYMFFRSAFAFLDYDKAAALVFLENLLMLLCWVFVGAWVHSIFRRSKTAECM